MKRLNFYIFSGLVFLAFLALVSFVLHKVYGKVEEEALKKNFFEVKRVVTSVDESLNDFFEEALSNLEFLANDKDVINNTPKGQKILNDYYKSHCKHRKTNFLYAISRIDENGVVIYATPRKKFIGFNTLSHPFIQKALNRKRPCISNIFTNLKGDKVLSIISPVFNKKGDFKGLLNFLVPFDYFMKYYVNKMEYNPNSEIHFLDKRGVVIFSYQMDDIGENFYEIPDHYFKYSSIFDKIKKRQVTSGEFLESKTSEGKAYFAYIDVVDLPFNKWTILVTMPEDTMMPMLNSFAIKINRVKYFVIIMLILPFFFYGMRERKFAKIFMEKEQVFKTVSQTSGQIAYEYDLKKNTITWFCNVKKILGYENDLFVDIPREKLIEYIHPDDREKTVAIFEKTLANKLKTMSRQFRLKHKDGHYVYVEEKSAIIYDKKKNPVKVFGSVRDVTLKKIQDEELKRYRENLEEMVVKRTKALERTLSELRAEIERRKEKEEELRKAKEKVEAVNKLKSEFLAQMSHEIRTPINVIVSHASLLQISLEDEIDEDLEASFKAISNAGNRIIRTVELILNMSDISTGSYQPTFKKWDVYHQIMQRVYLEYAPWAAEKNLHMTLEEPIGDTNEIVDEFSVRHIFANLIDNAIKYTEEGEIRIKMYRNSEKLLVVEIKDTGIGIDEEYLPFIYEPFSQEQQGYTRKFEGNGLGLALVREYAKLNNIEIKIETEKNKGTNFILIFRGVKE